MDWRDRLQPGSIGGIDFHTEQASGSGGRRLVIHEYPLQDVYYVEDMGGSAGSQRLTIFLVGSDYDLRRNELIKLIDSEGPHTLINPYLGTLRVRINQYEWAITTRRGGYVQFNLEYVLDGKRKFPQSANANAQQLQTACNSCSEALQSSFADEFSVDGKPGFVHDAALKQLTAATDSLAAIGAAAEQIDQLSTDLGNLLFTPASLASELGGLINSVMAAPDTITTALANYNALNAGFADVDIVPLTTPSRRHQATNQTATQQLLTGSATVEVARMVASQAAPFTTYEQAMSTRDQLLEQIDALIENGTDATYYPLVDLQTALIKRVDEVAPGLDKVKQIQLQQSVPALVLAHQLYGDANKADELISRNGVEHPSFMPPGAALEVLV